MVKRKTFKLIRLVETTFIEKLMHYLHLEQIKGPLLVDKATGLNDGLSGKEKPLGFSYKDKKLQIVQSLAKWKRHALKEYNYQAGEGIVVHMHAIRPDENEVSKYHSLHVDQYEWEKIITQDDRNLAFLEAQIKLIYKAIVETKKVLQAHTNLEKAIGEKLTIISSEQLLHKYPDLKPKAREKAYVKLKKAIFVTKVGHKLADGFKHDERAPDYDDWDLNGDLVVYDAVNDDAIELSSMGIRVNAKTLEKQHQFAKATEQLASPFHQSILNGHLPLTIGGGIGISRLNMFILEKQNILEVK